jgi:hypothetical protein
VRLCARRSRDERLHHFPVRGPIAASVRRAAAVAFYGDALGLRELTDGDVRLATLVRYEVETPPLGDGWFRPGR